MWGQEDDKVAGIEALKYIESLNVPVIGTNSKFLSMSKLDFKISAEKNNILTPNYYLFEKEDRLDKLDNINLKFPLIIKPTKGCGSLYMTEKSICYNIEELKEQIEILSKNINCEILIEEFIIGREFSIMVIEDKYDIMAMKPIIYEFPKNMSVMKQFLYFENKFDAIDNKEITYKLYDENEELMEKIKEIGCKSYKSLNVTGSGYARIDMRVDDKNNIFVLEVNPTPAFFCQLNNEFGDDYVIQKCFENGHNELMDYIINTKLYQINCCEIEKNYDEFSEKYDESFNESNYPYLLENISLNIIKM
jgi:D-alanine-D-alanine ligase-like ATP-grasp enzyme